MHIGTCTRLVYFQCCYNYNYIYIYIYLMNTYLLVSIIKSKRNIVKNNSIIIILLIINKYIYISILELFIT